MRLFSVATLLVALAMPAPVLAQNARIFETTSHDFGSVAKAAKTEFRFYFENPYDQPMHVRSVRTSCGCTTPTIETQDVPAKGRGSILAKFNTHTHVGQKAATVTVTIDRPFFTEFQLQVKGYIRTDVVFNPGEAMFGNISQGKSKEIQVGLDYAGRSDWKIVGLTTSDGFLKAVAKESTRSAGRVQYQITLTLAEDAPVGAYESDLVVTTNDRNLTKVPLRVMANIVPGITVSPTTVSLGDILPGDPIKQLVLLKSQQPFLVKSVTSDVFDIDVELKDEPKSLLPLQLVLKAKEGELGTEQTGFIRFLTDVADRPEIEIGTVFRRKAPAPAPAIVESKVVQDEQIDQDDQ
jgi:hypothetical protein